MHLESHTTKLQLQFLNYSLFMNNGWLGLRQKSNDCHGIKIQLVEAL